MDSQFRGFRPIWIVIPIIGALVVGLALAALAFKVSDVEQASMAAQAASAAVDPTPSSPSRTESADKNRTGPDTQWQAGSAVTIQNP